MPPKTRYTREEIVQAALELTRENGIAAVTARALANRLSCSAKPIFGQFRNMEEVQAQVLKAADAIYQARLSAAMNAGEWPPYKASGMAYIQFARQEPELFKLLFMRDRTGEAPQMDDTEEMEPIYKIIERNVGLNREEARRFHLENWIFVHGIASMLATHYLDWQTEDISRALTDLYEGLRHRFTEGGKANGSHPHGASQQEL